MDVPVNYLTLADRIKQQCEMTEESLVHPAA